MSATAYPVSSRLPRQFGPGLHWLGGCSDSGAWPGRAGRDVRHEHLSAYLVVGSEKTLLVDTGHFAQWGDVAAQLERCLDGRTLDYVFPTHQEVPHAGNLGRLLSTYPDAVVVGDTREYHLYFPELSRDRLERTRPGDTLDLGDRRFLFLEPVWFDLSGTLWGYEVEHGVLFSADGLGYVHEHTPDVCGLLPGEIPAGAEPFGILRFALPFVGMKYHDTRPGIQRFRDLALAHPVHILCSAHGVPLSGDEVLEVSEQLLEVVEENQQSISGPSTLRREGMSA